MWGWQLDLYLPRSKRERKKRWEIVTEPSKTLVEIWRKGMRRIFSRTNSKSNQGRRPWEQKEKGMFKMTRSSCTEAAGRARMLGVEGCF